MDISKLNPEQQRVAKKVAAAAERHGVPVDLALAAAMQESAMGMNLDGGAGPKGVMMVSKRLAKDRGIKQLDEDQNIDTGVWYLGQQLQNKGNVDDALIAYHDGPDSPYFKGGEASQAALNHINKVKGYMGEAKDNLLYTEVEPMDNGDGGLLFTEVSPLNSEELEKQSATPESMVAAQSSEGQAAPSAEYGEGEMAAGVLGGLGGMAHGVKVGKSKHQKELELKALRYAMGEYDKMVADSAKINAGKPQFGSAIANWDPTQFRQDVVEQIRDPMSMKHANKLAENIQQRIQKSEQLFPHQVRANPNSPIFVPVQPGGSFSLPTPEVNAPPVSQPQVPKFDPAKTRAGQIINAPGRMAPLTHGIAGGYGAAQTMHGAKQIAQGNVKEGALPAVSGVSAITAALAKSPKTKMIAGLGSLLTGIGGTYDEAKRYIRSILDNSGQPEVEVINKANGGMVGSPEDAARLRMIKALAEGGRPKDVGVKDKSYISATPEKYPVLGFIARALRGADEFARKPFGYENPPLEILSDVLSVPQLYRTIDNINYGLPLTRGAGQARRMSKDTQGALEALANIAPGAPAALRGAKTGAKAIAPTVARQAVNVAERYGVPPVMSVVKPKGGNWLSGSVEDAIEPLKLRDRYGMTSPEDLSAVLGVPLEEAMSIHRQNAPITDVNNWIEKKLSNYMRNEMATPEDPVRLALDAFPAKKAEMLAAKQAQIDKVVADMERARAERGFTPEMMTSSQARIRQLEFEKALIEKRTGVHYEPPMAAIKADESRRAAGYPVNPVSESPYGMAWEDVTDATISPGRAGTTKDLETASKNQWLSKVDPKTMVYSIDRSSARNLGFSHLADEMRNALNPSSGLPKELLIDPSKLQKMTLPQMIERVDQINAWRAVKTAEADAARAANAATVMHREYETIPGTGLPNERGMRWVELKNAEGADESALKDALKYEGEVMQHCVGGYCPDVVEGRSRIFSLRDAKGKPYTTIEIAPSGNPDVADSIVQIKGYRNRAPEKDVLPFVQDFVRSGKWGDVGDLNNAGLVKHNNEYRNIEGFE